VTRALATRTRDFFSPVFCEPCPGRRSRRRPVEIFRSSARATSRRISRTKFYQIMCVAMSRTFRDHIRVDSINGRASRSVRRVPTRPKRCAVCTFFRVKQSPRSLKAVLFQQTGHDRMGNYLAHTLKQESRQSDEPFSLQANLIATTLAVPP
jgi:hypothetical protein